MSDRLTFLQIVFFAAFLAVSARLLYWQVIRGPDLRIAAQSQYERITHAAPARGKVLTADGYPLVMNDEVYTVFATPKTLTMPVPTIEQLLVPLLFEPNPQTATIPGALEAERLALASQLRMRLSDTSKQWVSLKTGVSASQKKSIEGLSIHGLGFDPYPKRFYPEGSMAAHLVGFVGKDDLGNDKGYFGIEGKYDLELRGTQSTVVQETDAFGRPIAIADVQRVESLDSRDLTLTIRRDIQHILEQQLLAGVARYGAKAADAIIMEPTTGKILAMASVPHYDPANFSAYDTALYKNPLIADGYEPGSTFKVLTVAAGIEAGVITPQTQCDTCSGPVTIGQYTIKTWNNEYHPAITMTDALAKSDNTAMVFIGRKLGKDRFLSAIQSFGIGQETGIDLQEEATPKLRANDRWAEIDLATATFGQGVAVTGIQMLNAVSAIANDGVLMRPFTVGHVHSAQADYDITPQELRRVVSKETAQTVQTMMMESASHGDARWTLPKQYSIAGKTGTAQIPVDGHYDEERTIASFVGFAPAKGAKFAMLVRVVEPTSSPWGSETAAPLWFSIARELFVKFDIPKMQP